MGNSHSSETPRKGPQKLSKPRTGQRASTLGLSSHNGLQQSNPEQYSNAYRVGRPPSGVPPSPSSHVLERAYTVLSEVPSERTRPPDESRERERRLSGIVRANTFKQDYTWRNSMVAGSIHSFEQQSNTRANSMVHAAGTRSLTGDYAISLPAQSRRGSIHYDLPMPEPRSPMFSDTMMPQVPPLPTSQSATDPVEGSDAVPRSPQVQQSGSAAITRNNSEVSLYPPVRRRSIIQTPGVATRSPVALTNQSSFRRSLPPSPSVSRRNSVDTNTRRYNSMLPPPRNLEFESRERVVTPCEEDYKQLGGIKFGSLRIVNGSPAPVSTPDPLQKQARTAKQSLAAANSAQDHENESISNKEIIQPKPTSSVTSPVIASFNEISWDGRASSLAVAATSNDVLHSPSPMTNTPSKFNSPNHPLEVVSKRTEYEDGLFEPEEALECMRPEILNVKEVPLARASNTSDVARDSRRQTETVARSDSGFTSTSSSTTSGKPLSKTDSGYGSNLSLRSLRRSNSRARSPSKKTLSLGHDKRVRGVAEEEPAAPAAGVSGKKPPPSDDPLQRSGGGGLLMLSSSKSINFSSNALGLSILRPNKSRDGSMPKPRSTSRRTRPKSGGNQHVHEVDVSTINAQDGTSKQARLQRFWNSSRRKSLPAQYAPQDAPEPMPTATHTLDAQQIREDLLYPSTATLRLEPSKATLKTILSVSSVDLSQTQDTVLHSQEQESSDNGHVTSHYVRSYETVGPGATVTVAEIARPESGRGRRTSTRSYRNDASTHHQMPQLRSRSSAPSFLKVDPSLPASAFQDHTSRKGSKTPPPLSMRRQSMRSAARPQTQHSIPSSKSPRPNAPMSWQNAGIERLRTHSPIDELDQSTYKSYPYSGMGPTYGASLEFADSFDLGDYPRSHSGYRRGSTGQHTLNDSGLSVPQTFTNNGQSIHVQSRTRQSWGHITSRPELSESFVRRAGFDHHFGVEVPSQQVGRVASNPSMTGRNRRESVDPRRYGYGQTPPYRVLHSYDSPAYRNTPIWN